jgi:hypothetical protein
MTPVSRRSVESRDRSNSQMTNDLKKKSPTKEKEPTIFKSVNFI